MDFVFDKLESANCTQCGGLVDVAGRVAFTSVTCPHCKTPMPVPGKLGTLLLLEEVGTGAAGIVYKALDSTLQRHVAVKILKNEEGESSKKIVEATVAEARALAAINHPNVVHIHTIGMRHGQPYIVMELLIGSGKLNVMLKEGWVADEKRGLEIAIDVAQGLRAAQGAGLLHRDVKPGNILFNNEGVAKLLDFSVVHAATGDGEKIVIGTPYYISPEAARGLEVDFRSDIYSLGATVFHLLTGQPVFDGETSRDVMRARLKQKAPDIRSIKPGFSAATAAVMARMLATDAADRQASYDELINDLKDALDALITGQAAEPVNHELAQLHNALSGSTPLASAVPVASSKRSRAPVVAPAKKGLSPAMIGIAIAAGLALVVGVLVAVMSGGKDDKDKSKLAVNLDPRRQRIDEPVGETGETTGDDSSSSKDGGNIATDPATAPDGKDENKGNLQPDPEPEPEPKPDPKPEPKPDPVKPPEVKPPQPPQPQPPPQVTFEQAFKAWDARVTAQIKRPATQWQVMMPTGLGVANGTTLKNQPDGSVIASGKNEAMEILIVESAALKIKHSEITGLRIEALPHDSLPGKGPGRGVNGNFVLSHITAVMRRTSEVSPPLSPANVFIFGAADADFSQASFPAVMAIDNNLQSGWAISPRLGQPTSAMFLVRNVPAAASENDMILRVMLHHQSPHGQHTLGHFRLSVTTDKDPFLPLNFPENIEAIVRSAKRTKDEEKELETYFRRVKLEGLEYVPPGGLAQGTTPGKATPATPAVVAPPPPKLDAYEAVELSKMREQKLYDAEPDALVLIPRFSEWHYWADAEAPSANWAAANFVASGWKLGDASFGYGPYDNLRTQLKEMKGSHNSVYIRAPFKVATPAKLKDLLLQGRFDDAIVVHLNGQIVYRSENLSGAGSSAKVSTPTARAVVTSIELKDAVKHLKAGVNVIAIECHNAAADDIDFIVDPALIATLAPEPRKAVANNKKDNWGVKDGKLFTDSTGLIVDGEAKAPTIENTTTKTDFDDRSYSVRVLIKFRNAAAGQIKVDARCKPKTSNTTVDSATQNVPAFARMRDVFLDVKVTGKLQALAIRLPDGESVVESIRVINRRDNKVLEQWDFTK